MSGFRVADPRFGRLIDRRRPLAFTLDGRKLSGFAGDTLASAVLASRASPIARSFKLHRPRGLQAIGPDEPNALVSVLGPLREPNRPMTEIELVDGLAARTQGGWPSTRFDLRSVAGLFKGVLPSGFQYKTMKWPARLWPSHERALRRATIFGRVPSGEDTTGYEHINLDVDVLVVGGGIAGIVAASAAARAGLRVLLAEQDTRLGGTLDGYDGRVDGMPALEWARARVAELAAADNVHLLTRTSAAGLYDHGFCILAERAPGPKPTERLWKVRAGAIVIATGAQEKPLIFPDNDRPGIMLAQAARLYLRRYGVAPGRRIVIATSGDEGYRTALDLRSAGIEIARLVDLRLRPDSPVHHLAKAGGIPMAIGSAPVGTTVNGRGRRISGVTIENRLTLEGPALKTEINCDCLIVSGGFAPILQLCGHLGVPLPYDPALGAHRAVDPPPGLFVAGAANGRFNLDEVLTDAWTKGAQAARHLGAQPPAEPAFDVDATADDMAEAVGMLPDISTRAQAFSAFVDQQNDVTVGDMTLCAQEGYGAPELMKRYSGLGLGTDQGRTSHANAATLRQWIDGSAEHTTHRPPWRSLPFALVAGHRRGENFAPPRRSAVEAAGARLETSGAWRVAEAFPLAGENIVDAARREAEAARHGTALVDLSCCEKIRVFGPDAVAFLRETAASPVEATDLLEARDILFLDERGMLLARAWAFADLEQNVSLHVQSGRIYEHLDVLARTSHSGSRVAITDETDRWADLLLMGPQSDALTHDLLEGLPPASSLISVKAFGQQAHVLRVAAGFAAKAWQDLVANHDITPIGEEACRLLRADAGEILIGEGVSREHSAVELRMGDLLSPDIATRQKEPRRMLVGIEAEDAGIMIAAGSHLLADAERDPPRRMLGHVVASIMSPSARRPHALAVVDMSIAKSGSRAFVRQSGAPVEVRIVPPALVKRETVR